MEGPAPDRSARLPLKATVAWLVGTYVLFLVGQYAPLAKNLGQTTLFAAAAVTAFAVGYLASLRLSPSPPLPDRAVGAPSQLVRLVIAASALWFLAYGAFSLIEYGALSWRDIWASLLDPASGYFDKFEVYRRQEATGAVNRPLQVTVLSGALYAALLPLTIRYWRHLGPWLRAWILLGVSVYALYFVYIGTLKGLGDLLILGAAAGAVVLAPMRSNTGDDAVRGRRRRYLGDRSGRPGVQRRRASTRGRAQRSAFARAGVATTAATLVFVLYMAFNQSARVDHVGVADRYQGSGVAAAVLGPRLATGLNVVIAYPTHGYLGLSKNLAQPFEFGGGLSGFPSIAGYKVQYLGGPDPMLRSYPLRTERATGWPARQYWGTVYPWLASVVSFPGVLGVMAVIGWAAARLWRAARSRADDLALILFCQLSVLLAYVPANNQLFENRYATIAVVTLVGIYLLRPVFRRRPTGRARSVRAAA
ncbi:hypothetical protein [Blastococcus capsensis]|uniref:hypothetical protein n=1 Tax=Blastococcus capsensis TaxID=1564163 RepID=UPI002541ADB7|nr:hypothetical protein [Blastococcus capsensis]MDK3257131.1 hypothetical protein [Blastococcus capsensis]